jgi:hypothetical protein
VAQSVLGAQSEGSADVPVERGLGFIEGQTEVGDAQGHAVSIPVWGGRRRR